MRKPYFQNGTEAQTEQYRKGGNGVTWKAVATAAVAALASVLFWQMQTISTKVDKLDGRMNRMEGWMDAQKDPAPATAKAGHKE